MTVAQLIDALADADPALPVLVRDGRGGLRLAIAHETAVRRVPDGFLPDYGVGTGEAGRAVIIERGAKA